LEDALGFATVAAFDSGILPLVAKVLHGKVSDKLAIIAGAAPGSEPGREPAPPDAIQAAPAIDSTPFKYCIYSNNSFFFYFIDDCQ
jgi:phage/plasmid primase-like uncharacterized protein